MSKSLAGRKILITGGARRIGREIALGVARAGADVVIHFGNSKKEAEKLIDEIQALDVKAYSISQDLYDLKGTSTLIERTYEFLSIDCLINNAAIFEDLEVQNTDLECWQRHMDVNITAPFLLSKTFAQKYQGINGKIINVLDWRALRPGKDHFAYTISKAGLSAMTKSLALAFAPNINVNGIALGAILPPSDGGDISSVLQKVPLKRWAKMQEIIDTVLFLIKESNYTTGEIIHLDGGRHIV